MSIPIPDGLRIGPVSYLNTRPLIRTLERAGLSPDIPAELARKFYSGQLDAALMPVFAILEAGGGRIVDHVAIACQGEVYSVIVASRGSFSEAGKIHLDPASRSSVALLRVLLAEFYPGGPTIAEEPVSDENAARLLIGDAAISFRQAHNEGWQYHDLGALWLQHTGLPFTFAVWVVAKNAGDAVFPLLRQAKEEGLPQRGQIAAEEPDPAFAYRYLTEFIRYDLGDREKEAIRLFELLARKHGILPQGEPVPLEFL